MTNAYRRYSREHFEAEDKALIAAMNQRRELRKSGALHELERIESGPEREPEKDYSAPRSYEDWRDEVSYLHGLLYSETDPQTVEAIKLQIFRMTGEIFT